MRANRGIEGGIDMAGKPRAGRNPEGTAGEGPRLRSRITVQGDDRAPHRTFLRAMGLDDEAIAKPFVGVMSTHGENTPCSLSLRPQAEAAKTGVAIAGGTPFEFTTVSVSDGRSEEHTSELQSRENLVCRLLLEKKKDTPE